MCEPFRWPRPANFFKEAFVETRQNFARTLGFVRVQNKNGRMILGFSETIRQFWCFLNKPVATLEATNLK